LLKQEIHNVNRIKWGEVSIENHQTEWEFSAKNTIDILKNTLNNDIVDAQHIGSTSIKSICAKPIIDIVVGVKNFKDILKHNDELSKLGIIYRRQDHPNQQLYVCGDLQNNIQTHFIHVVIFNSKEWNDYINMRDYLNANEQKAKEYSKLKEHKIKTIIHRTCCYFYNHCIFSTYLHFLIFPQ